MDQATSLLSFIATYAKNWTHSYIQSGYAQARLAGTVLPDVAFNTASMLGALEQSANLYPEGRMAYATKLANTAQLDKGISLIQAGSQIRGAASALGAEVAKIDAIQLNGLLGHVEQAGTPTTKIVNQGFNFDPNGGVIVTDNGKNSTPDDKPKGGFWDGFDFNSVSDLLIGLGGITSSILAGQPYKPGGANGQQGGGQTPQLQTAQDQAAKQGKFIKTVIIVVGVAAVALIGIILWKKMKSK